VVRHRILLLTLLLIFVKHLKIIKKTSGIEAASLLHSTFAAWIILYLRKEDRAVAAKRICFAEESPGTAGQDTMCQTWASLTGRRKVPQRKFRSECLRRKARAFGVSGEKAG
jgi:hypothetical protein